MVFTANKSATVQREIGESITMREAPLRIAMNEGILISTGYRSAYTAPVKAETLLLVL